VPIVHPWLPAWLPFTAFEVLDTFASRSRDLHREGGAYQRADFIRRCRYREPAYDKLFGAEVPAPVCLLTSASSIKPFVDSGSDNLFEFPAPRKLLLPGDRRSA